MQVILQHRAMLLACCTDPGFEILGISVMAGVILVRLPGIYPGMLKEFDHF